MVEKRKFLVEICYQNKYYMFFFSDYPPSKKFKGKLNDTVIPYDTMTVMITLITFKRIDLYVKYQAPRYVVQS